METDLIKLSFMNHFHSSQIALLAIAITWLISQQFYFHQMELKHHL